MVKIAVVTVSDRVSRGEREDASGPLAASLLSAYGEVVRTDVVPDGVDTVTAAISGAADAGVNVVFTTGGTGVTGRDQTPEATEALIEQRMFGIENLLRSNPNVPQAALSRGLAGVGRFGGLPVLIINAPGSVGGVRDAVRVVGPLLEHIVSQMRDGDHPVPQGEDPFEGFDGHLEATSRVQNRGRSQGGAARVVIAGVSDQTLEMGVLIDAVDDQTAGAVVTFCGQVRNHDDGRQVTAIDYEAHPDAGRVVEEIAEQVAQASGACRIAVLHRTGHLEVGGIALGAAVSAPHRAEAFRLLEAVIEQVKMKLPVWKQQHFADGTKEWTGVA